MSQSESTNFNSYPNTTEGKQRLKAPTKISPESTSTPMGSGYPRELLNTPTFVRHPSGLDPVNVTYTNHAHYLLGLAVWLLNAISSVHEMVG